jgi:hypothetical protein
METYITTSKQHRRQPPQKGYTPLMEAMETYVKLETLEFLVANGADVNAINEVPDSTS